MADRSQLKVTILTPEKLVFRGTAESVLLPGEKGVFEVLPHHKRLMSRLLSGIIVLDGKKLAIKRGVAKVALNEVTIIVEEKP